MTPEDRATQEATGKAGYAYVEYERIDATEIEGDGSLRLYRRRGLFGLLRRQDVFHPAGEWHALIVHPSGKCQVTLRRLGHDR